MSAGQVFLDGNRDRKRTLVVIFLRGGADGLNMVIPVEDDAYHRARPKIGVGKKSTVALDGFFALNPQLEALKRSYDDGNLLIVHEAGSEDTTRSHFEAQDFMDHGGLVGGGWIGRFLRYRPNPADGPLSAVAIGKALPESLRGAPAATVMESFADFAFGDGKQGYARELRRLYELEKGQLARTARDTFSALERIETLKESDYHPEHGAEYPETDFAGGLSRIAQMIKARVGLEAASIDLGGWDSHFVQSAIMDPLMNRFSEALAAFYQDLGPAMDTTTVVVMTEFGRRVGENASFGTAHGRAGVMFLLGGGLAGGRVISQWKGLGEEQLEGPGDLAVVHNYRDVLAPILRRHGATDNFDLIFPDYKLNPLDLYG